MNFTQYRCVICGGDLKLKGDIYECKYCGANYHQDKAKEYAEEVRKIFDEALAEQKEEQIANCRRNLWKAAHAEHVSSTEVNNCARELKKLLPDDFQANFYEVATSGTPKQINAFLNKIDVSNHGIYVEAIADYLLRSLESSNVLPLKDLITRSLKDKKYTEYITKVEDEAVKLKQGLYSPQVPRDVFLAYSSKDYKAVNEIVEFLEENKISCFVALRNLRHGKGSVENYKNHLYTAMHNCKCVVFLSSENSRDLDCDALKIELPYIKNNEPQIGRIEYILADYGRDTSYAAKLILEDFFNGQEYCRTKEDLIKRVLKYITGDMGETAAASAAQDIKYCISCGEKNPVKAKRCMECGSADFADDYESYLRAKIAREYEEKFKKQQEELARAKAEKEEVKTKTTLKFVCSECGASNSHWLGKCPSCGKFNTMVEVDPKTEENYPTLSNYDKSEFEIVGKMLKKYTGKKSEVIIPQGIASIGPEAFNRCENLISISIPNSVILIGKYAFGFCKSLTSVTIPNSVTVIGESAFYDCENLTSIIIPNSVTSIGNGAFGYCKSLTNIIVEQGNKNYYSKDNCVIEILSKKLIFGCNNSVIPIDGSVTSLGTFAFAGCIKLTKIIIPNSVTSFGLGVFLGCDSITNITVEQGNKIYYSKDNCVIEISSKKLILGCKNSIIPTDGSVTSIGENAFGFCSQLISVTIPNSVTLIGAGAFSGCKNLKSLIIPNSVTSIEKQAFSRCSNLKIINCEATSKPVGWDREWLGDCKAQIVWNYSNITYDKSEFEINGKILTKYKGNKSEVVIPQGVTTIAEHAFYFQRDIISITVPNSVTSIGKESFCLCMSLKSITIPNSVTTIGNSAFSGCGSLDKITIPNSVNSIGDYAFSSCKSLTSITIPNSVTTIGSCVFNGCKKLKTIYFEGTITSIDWNGNWRGKCKAKVVWGYKG